MPKAYTSHFKERTGSSSGEEPVYLVEISHPQLAQPIRVVRDNQDLVSNGNNYIAFAFEVGLPDDVEGQLPRAPIRMDNVGGELTAWLDASQGGRGSQVRIMQVMRDTPNVLEYDTTLDLLNVRRDGAFVYGELGYEDTLSLPALGVSHRPDITPGIF